MDPLPTRCRIDKPYNMDNIMISCVLCLHINMVSHQCELYVIVSRSRVIDSSEHYGINAPFCTGIISVSYSTYMVFHWLQWHITALRSTVRESNEYFCVIRVIVIDMFVIKMRSRVREARVICYIYAPCSVINVMYMAIHWWCLYDNVKGATLTFLCETCPQHQ